MLNGRTCHAEWDVSYKPEQYRKIRHFHFGTLPPDKISTVNQEDLRHSLSARSYVRHPMTSKEEKKKAQSLSKCIRLKCRVCMYFPRVKKITNAECLSCEFPSCPRKQKTLYRSGKESTTGATPASIICMPSQNVTMILTRPLKPKACRLRQQRDQDPQPLSPRSQHRRPPRESGLSSSRHRP